MEPPEGRTKILGYPIPDDLLLLIVPLSAVSIGGISALLLVVQKFLPFNYAFPLVLLADLISCMAILFISYSDGYRTGYQTALSQETEELNEMGLVISKETNDELERFYETGEATEKVLNILSQLEKLTARFNLNK